MSFPPSPTTDSGTKFLTAEWRLLAMLNYEIDPALVQPLVPRGTELDFFQGQTFVSVVGFMFLGTRLLGIPIPFHRHFEEVNLRLYVRREVGGEVRRGVTFVKEIVPRWAIAKVARWAYNENYESLPMRHRFIGLPDPRTGAMAAGAGVGTRAGLGAPSVEYGWRTASQWNSLRIAVDGVATPLVHGSLAEFITEHYWGYCSQRDGGTLEYRVEHPSWNVWTKCVAELNCDVERLYGSQFVAALSRPPASAFLADGSRVAVGRPTRLS